MKRSKFNASYFIEIFADIPADDWTRGAFTRNGKCCALGHLGGAKDRSGQAHGLILLFRKYLKTSPAKVNDGHSIMFQQKTPKQRILAALFTIQALRRKQKVSI